LLPPRTPSATLLAGKLFPRGLIMATASSAVRSIAKKLKNARDGFSRPPDPERIKSDYRRPTPRQDTDQILPAPCGSNPRGAPGSAAPGWRHRLRSVQWLCLMLVLAGCTTAGPDFVIPEAPVLEQWREADGSDGANLSWELDFWDTFRRAIESAWILFKFIFRPVFYGTFVQR
jgi:hypothetical protein